MPFIKVNCGAIPESLVESSFFGFEKGSFTGAVSSNRGYFEQAHRGTIFLDEVGELSPAAQSRLLRVLETREVQKIGSEHASTVDFRVIAATNRDLGTMVERGEFRKDLYYRLSVYPLKIPPLRNRHKDIQVLVKHFFNFFASKMEVSPPPFIGSKERQAIKNYSWPGNVRQLKTCIERAMLNAKISTQELGYSQHLYFPELTSDLSRRTRARRSTPDTEMSEQIMAALESCGGKIFGKGGAAEKMGVNASTLRSRMRRLSIPFGTGRDGTADD